MIRDKEALFPTHEDGASVAIGHCEERLPKLGLDVSEGREAGPVDHVFLFASIPIACEEAIPTANDFGVKVGGQFWPVFSETADAEIAT
jgi:hypothetical protein